jgi:2-polyprenyl-3-methyl-5-hydroxy-6-metoxy-1,4-benzoquinol methylase
MLKYIPTCARKILDVGCASGGFGKNLKRTADVEVWGVEPCEAAAKVAAESLDHVFSKPFDRALDLPQNYFDCVIFNDVLEHFVDPFDALDYSKSLLNDSGVVVASLPNVRYFGNICRLLIDKDWKYCDNGILDRTHLRFFTKRSIVRTFEEQGYRIKRIEGIGSLDERKPNEVLKFNLLNFFLMQNLEDMRHFQFAVVASLV